MQKIERLTRNAIAVLQITDDILRACPYTGSIKLLGHPKKKRKAKVGAASLNICATKPGCWYWTATRAVYQMGWTYSRPSDLKWAVWLTGHGFGSLTTKGGNVMYIATCLLSMPPLQASLPSALYTMSVSILFILLIFEATL